MKNIPFSKVALAGNETKYFKEVLSSGWLTTSTKTLLFEKSFSEFVGAKYACAVNSCTSALHLALEAIGIKPGDRVLVPSLTFTASAEILRYLGAHPVFVDVEYGTNLVSPQIIKKALSKHPDVKALILVHYGGQAPLMTTPEREGIIDICRNNNVRIIEDAAHAFPTKFNDRYIGSFGDVTCFSFYANKPITTGEGGMLVTDNINIYERAKTMRLHGINRDIWERYISKKPSWEYDVVAPGFKYNMPDINAAIGLAQLEKADFFRSKRQKCAIYYFEHLKDLEELDLPTCTGPIENHAWHLFPIIIKPESLMARNDFVKKLADNGIATSVHYKPLHRMSYYQIAYNLNPNDYPNTEKIWNGVVSLPIYPDLKNDELKYICKTIRSFLK